MAGMPVELLCIGDHLACRPLPAFGRDSEQSPGRETWLEPFRACLSARPAPRRASSLHATPGRRHDGPPDSQMAALRRHSRRD